MIQDGVLPLLRHLLRVPRARPGLPRGDAAGRHCRAHLPDDFTGETVRDTKYYKASGIYYRAIMDGDDFVYAVSHAG